MVAIVRPVPPGSLTAADPKAFASWLEQIGAGYAANERAAIGKALDLARVRYDDLRTGDGEPWLDRALGTAGIVAALKLDADSVRAAILLGAPFAPDFDAAALAESFGAEVAQIVVGAARMGAIRAAPGSAAREDHDLQAENLRKMLLAMVEDIRVVLIKLAERTQALRFAV